MKYAIIYVLLLTGLSLSAQFERHTYQFEKQATFDPQTVKEDFFPKLYHIDEAPSPDGLAYRDYLLKIKQKIQTNTTTQTPSYKTNEDTVFVNQVFESNQATGQPNDNDLAISNDGKLISVVNSTMFMMDVNDSTIAPTEISLAEFALVLDTLVNVYDPKVVYDPIEDRFIVVFLNEYDSENSSIIVGFSTTADPLDPWNVYAIPGSPFGTETWSDYPMLALTEDELFISINLLQDNSSWILGFTQTIIWQLDKNKGYVGEDLLSGLWDQTNLDNRPIRNAIPVQGGSDLQGPNIYFLSNRNFDETNDSIFIMQVTGSLTDDDATLEVDVRQSNINYGVPPDARQKQNNKFLQTNDGRILGAFHENDKIHFVSTTVVPSTGFAGIYHGQVTEVSGAKNVSAQIISDPIKDLGYPNLSFTGFEGSDQCVISFNFSSLEDFPGGAAIFYNEGAYSDMTILKEGNKIVGTLSPSTNPVFQRWGDYSGSVLKYNEPGTVWTCGTFGKAVGSGPTSAGVRGTWVAQLTSPIEQPSTSLYNHNNDFNIKTFPNPTTNYIYTEFSLQDDEVLNIRLYNTEGQLVKDLLTSYAQQGKNQFRFSTHLLPKGTYILNITNTKNKIIANKKIILN